MPNIKKVILTGLLFSTDSFPEKINKGECSISLEHYFKKKPYIANSEFSLDANMTFKILCKAGGQDIFSITASYLIAYIGENVTEFDVLKDAVIVSHVIPYFREQVSNITMRSPYPPLWFQTVNTHGLYEQYFNKVKEKSSKKTKNSKKNK